MRQWLTGRSPNSPTDDDTSPSPRWLWRAGITMGGFTVLLGSVGGTVGLSRGEDYVRQTLLPQISQDLSASFHRPVQLGAVESLSWRHIRLGASAIPATATDADAVTIEAVEIRFNPLSALHSQTVALDVTLINPQLVLDQNAAGDWLETEVELADDERITVRHLRIRGGAIALAPNPSTLNGQGVLHDKAVVDLPTRFEFEAVRADVTLGDGLEAIALNLSGHSRLDGQFSLRGHVELPPDAAPHLDLRLHTQALSTLPLNLALPPAIRLIDGTLTTRLHLRGPLDADPTLTGRVTLDNAAAWVAGEPNPFTATSGEFRIRNQEILLSQGVTRYGPIPFQVQGRIHLTEGLDLAAQVASVSVPDFMDTFNFTLPVAAEGALTTDNLRVTGPLEGAIFAGTVTNAAPIQLDRLTIPQASTDFSFNTQSDRLQLIDTTAKPEVGGQVVVQADIQLDEGDNDEIALTLEAENLPGDAIAHLYDLGLPAHALGDFAATGTVHIAQQRPQIELRWASQGGDYPTEGTVALRDDGVRLEEAIAWIGNQPIPITGTLADGHWQLSAQANAMPLTALPVALPLDAPLTGTLDGTLTIAGTLDSPTLEAITATGDATLALEAGAIAAQANLRDGTWQTRLQSQELDLTSLMALIPETATPWQGKVAGDVTLSGTVQDLTPGAMQADGTVQLANLRQGDAAPLFDRPLTAAFQWADNRLHLHHLRTEGLAVNGWLAADPQDLQAGDMNLHIALQDYDLASLPVPLPAALQIAGRTRFDGSLSGSLAAPHLQGNLQLQDFALNDLALHPLLQGRVTLAAEQGGEVQLAGGEDAIALTLSPSWQPTDLHLQLDQGTVAVQQPTTDRWHATLQNLSLERLLPVAAGVLPASLPPLAGALSAEVTVNLAAPDDPRLSAAFAIAQPRPQSASLPAERHRGDRLTGRLTYAQQQLALTDGTLHFGNSRAQLRAQVLPGPQPDIRADLTIPQGDLQDLATLARSLNLVPTALPLSPDTPVLTAFSQNDTAPTAPALPLNLPNFAGTFSSTLQVRASGDRAPTVRVDLQGQDWAIGTLGVQSIRLHNARLQNQSLSLERLDLSGLQVESATGTQHFDTHLRAARAADGQWRGALQADDLPLARLADLLGVPVAVSGEMDAIAYLSGNQPLPQLNGTLGIHNACFAALPLEDMEMAIGYQGDSINLDGWDMRLPTSLAALNPNADRPLRTAARPIRRSTEPKSLVIHYGVPRASFALADLETFAATGEMPPAWSLYLDLAGLEPATLRQALTQPLPIDLQWGDRLLNSTLGSTLLTAAGQILHTPARQSSATALRAALIQALQDDHQLTALEVLQHYPLDELHVDAAQLLALLGNAGCDRP